MDVSNMLKITTLSDSDTVFLLTADTEHTHEWVRLAAMPSNVSPGE